MYNNTVYPYNAAVYPRSYKCHCSGATRIHYIKYTRQIRLYLYVYVYKYTVIASVKLFRKGFFKSNADVLIIRRSSLLYDMRSLVVAHIIRIVIVLIPRKPPTKLIPTESNSSKISFSEKLRIILRILCPITHYIKTSKQKL